jgi:glutathione-regulated potassium-efflux system ancillary protein KefC
LPHFEIASFLAATIGLLALISICLLVFERLGVGSIVAFLVAGLVTGEIRDLPPHTAVALREFAELGVILLLFLIGLETTPPQLRGLGRNALTFGVPQITVSAVVISLYAWWSLPVRETAIILGLGFALSSTVVVMQILADRNELQSPLGQKAFAILLAQDLAIVPMLLAIPLMANEAAAGAGSPPWWTILRAIVAVALIVVVGRFVLTRILTIAVRQQNAAAFVCMTFLAVLSAALAAERAGLSMALGTFLLGAVLSTSPLGHRIAETIEPVKSTLLALFFFSVGLSIDLEIATQSWSTLLLTTAVVMILKFAIVAVLVLLSGGTRPEALRLGLMLAQCGEFGFVLFAAAQADGLMSAKATTLASVLITLSMLATPFLVRLSDHLAGPPGRRGRADAAPTSDRH